MRVPWLTGVRADLARRAPHYGADWRDGWTAKSAAAVGFLFFACLAPAIAFGAMMSTLTGGAIGVVEMIVATAGCGVLYAVFAGQPLTILGGTGPLLVFTGILYGVCQRLGLEFLPTYRWVGLWTAFFVILLGLGGASRFIAIFTRFTDETFAALISLIFIYEALRGVLQAFPAQHLSDDTALFGLVLALGTYLVARALSDLRHGRYLRSSVRVALADFGPALAILVMVLVRRQLPSVMVPSLDVPATVATSTGRGWWLPWGGTPLWAVAASALPALLGAVLIYLDQNITIRIVQSPQNGLRKGSAYHWDLVVVGVLIGACSCLGLPWLVAATVRSINHVRALSSGEGAGTAVVETRVTGLLIHAGLALSLLATGWLREVPLPVLHGLFLYMGVSSLQGNQLFERMKLWLTDPKLYPEFHYIRRAPRRVVHAFTAVQTACLVVLWYVKSSPLGLLFPLFIALLVPVRALLARWISADHLAALDSDESPEELEDEFGGP